DGFVDEDGNRRVAAVDRGRIDKWLERRPDLSFRLRCAVELASREIEATNHGAYLAGPIVDRDECTFDHRILFERNRLRHATLHRADFNLHDIAHIQEISGGCLARPRERALGQVDFVGANAEPGAAVSALLRRNCGHQRWHDIACENGPAPAVGRERRERTFFGDDVPHLAEAAVPLVERTQAAIDGTIGRFLQFGIQSALYLEAVLIERIGAVFLLERLSDFFSEVRCHGWFGTRLALQHQRTLLCVARLLVRKEALLGHPLKHVVAPHQRRLRVDEWAEPSRRLNDARDDRRLFYGDVFRWLVKVESRGGLDAVRAVAKIDLIRVERKDFGLREPLLDLDGHDPFLDLPLW